MGGTIGCGGHWAAQTTGRPRKASCGQVRWITTCRVSEPAHTQSNAHIGCVCAGSGCRMSVGISTLLCACAGVYGHFFWDVCCSGFMMQSLLLFILSGGLLFHRYCCLSSGYHFHNFYPDDQTIRNKYATYGHPRPVKALQNPTLHEISDDMDRALACVFNESDMLQFPTTLKPVPFKHRLPVYFDVQWAEHRHQSVQKLANHGRDERARETMLKDANFSKRESSFRASVGVHS